jgi:hypothetical protein
MADGETDRKTSIDRSGQRVERGIRFVSAAPQAIFDLLADPTRHGLIDGSNTVRGAVEGNPQRLYPGAKFAMSMKQGVQYKITNEVVEFEEPTLIAWRHLGRHVWRYRLRPVEGGTEVTEEFDWSVSLAHRAYPLAGIPKRNAAAIEATLDRLAAHFAEP